MEKSYHGNQTLISSMGSGWRYANQTKQKTNRSGQCITSHCRVEKSGELWDYL